MKLTNREIISLFRASKEVSFLKFLNKNRSKIYGNDLQIQQPENVQQKAQEICNPERLSEAVNNSWSRLSNTRERITEGCDSECPAINAIRQKQSE